ncbi:hypothetical protein UFOVP139_32 [uncultured Caudovirales phage]|uniref:Uncharacterized protein n=1 Tax=uncultured Caudovirales phage TaxID=2100421 RepID=A0A6J5LGN2_9CAUD|nr:hypothetical protein UFOVP139_32 [uncultured Caudovirales phage]
MKDHIYTPATTDITIRWRKLYGYVPASEQEFYKKKWADWKAVLAKGVEDLPELRKKPRLDVLQMRKAN